MGDAEHLEFSDASFDSVICTLALCSVPDDRQTIAEVGRVLRARERMVLVEHVRSPLWPVRVILRLLAPVLLWLENDHVLRDPLDYLTAEGFEVEICKRSKWGIVERIVARKTGTPQ